MSESKSELKRLCTLNPIEMGMKFFELQQENADLLKELEAVTAENESLCESFDGVKNVLHNTQKELAAIKQGEPAAHTDANGNIWWNIVPVRNAQLYLAAPVAQHVGVIVGSGYCEVPNAAPKEMK